MAVDNVGVYTPDNLIAGASGSAATNPEGGILKAGVEYKKGSLVIQLVADSDKYTLAQDFATITAAEKQTAKILSEDVDATAVDVEAILYRTGKFNADSLTIGGADTADIWKEQLRDVGIILVNQAENSGV